MKMYLNKPKSDYKQLSSVEQTPHFKSRISHENEIITPTRPHNYDSHSNHNFAFCDQKSLLAVCKMEDAVIHTQQNSLKKFPTEMPHTPKSHRFSLGHQNNSTPGHEAPFIHNYPWNHHHFSSTPVIKLPEQRDGYNLNNTNTAHRHQFNSTPAHQNNLPNRLLHSNGPDPRKYLHSIFNNPQDLSLSSKRAESSSGESYQEEPINYSVHSRNSESSTAVEPQIKQDASKWTDDQITANNQVYIEGCGEDQTLMFHTEDTPSRSSAPFNDITQFKSKSQAGNVCNNDNGAASKEDFYRSHYPRGTTTLSTPDKALYVNLEIERHTLKTDTKAGPYAHSQGKQNQAKLIGHFKDQIVTTDQTKVSNKGGAHMDKVPKPAGHFVKNIQGAVKQVPTEKIDQDRQQMSAPSKDPRDVTEQKSGGHQEVKSINLNAVLSTSEGRTKEFSHSFPALFSLLDISQDSACESSLSSCAASDRGHRSGNVSSAHDSNSASFGFNLQPSTVGSYRAVVSQKSWDLANNIVNMNLQRPQAGGFPGPDRLTPHSGVPNSVPNTFYTPQASRSLSGNSVYHPFAFATPQLQRYATRDIKTQTNQMARPVSSGQNPAHLAPKCEIATPYRSTNEITPSYRPVSQITPPLGLTIQKILSSNLITQPAPPYSLANPISSATRSASGVAGPSSFNASVLGRDTSTSNSGIETKTLPSLINSTGVVPRASPLHMNYYGSHTMKHTCLLHQSMQVKPQNKIHRCKECTYEEVQEEVRRANDQIDREINEDQVLTFHTENTPSQSSGSSSNKSLAGSSESGRAEVEAKIDIDEFEFLESFQDSNNLTVIEANKTLTWGDFDKTPVSGETRSLSRAALNSTQGSTGPMVISGNSGDGLVCIDTISSDQTSDVLHFHNDLNEGSLDQTKSYNEEGTPLCFSRVSSLSSLHSSEARDHDGGNKPVINVLGKNLANIDEIETHEAKMAYFTDKTPIAAKFEYNPNIPDSPLMFSRGSSPQSLSSFDMQSIHSNVVSEHSLRASDVTSPEALDSPLGSTTSKKMDSPTQRSGNIAEQAVPLTTVAKVNIPDETAALDPTVKIDARLSSVSHVKRNSVADRVTAVKAYVSSGADGEPQTLSAAATHTVPVNPGIISTTYGAPQCGATVSQAVPVAHVGGPKAIQGSGVPYPVKADSVKMSSHTIAASTYGAFSILSSFISLDDVDSNEDCVRRYATEDTPSLYSSPSGMSLAPESPKKSTVLSPENDAKSDNSSLWKESEELLLQQIIQSGMPKSKTGRRLPGKELVRGGAIQTEKCKEGGSLSSVSFKMLKNNPVTVHRQKVACQVGNVGGTYDVPSSRSVVGEAGDARSKGSAGQTPNRFSAACMTTVDQILLDQFVNQTLPKSRITRRCLVEQFAHRGEVSARIEPLSDLGGFGEKVEHGDDDYNAEGVKKCWPESREDSAAAAPSTWSNEEHSANIKYPEKDKSCEHENEEEMICVTKVKSTRDACTTWDGEKVDIVDDDEAGDLIEDAKSEAANVGSLEAVNVEDVRTCDDSKGAESLGQESQIGNFVSCKGVPIKQGENQETSREKVQLRVAKNTEIKPGVHWSQDGTGRSTGAPLINAHPIFKENNSKMFKGFSYNNESSLLMSFRDCADVYSAVFNGNNIVELADDTDDDDTDDDDVDSFIVQQPKSASAAADEFGDAIKSWGKADLSVCERKRRNEAVSLWNGKLDIPCAENEELVHDVDERIDDETQARVSNFEDDTDDDRSELMSGVLPDGEENFQAGNNDSLDEEWMTESSLTSSSLSVCSFGDCPEFTPCNRGQVASFFEINHKIVGPAGNMDRSPKQDKKNKPLAEKGKSKLKVAQSLKRLFGSMRPGKGKESHLKSLAKGKGRSPSVDLSKGGHGKSKIKGKKKSGQ